MRTSTAGKSNESGFTLIELVVVVALLALFATFTIPLFGRIGSSGLQQSARRLNSTIRYLYNESAMTGREYRLIFDLERKSYRAKVLQADGEIANVPESGQATRLAGETSFRDLQVPGRGTFTSGEVTIRIHPTGWLEENWIHLQDSSEKQLTLHISPLTGAAEMFDGYKSM